MSGESNASLPYGKKPTTCSQQSRVCSEPQASTSSDGGWSARGAKDLASKSSRAALRPRGLRKGGHGESKRTFSKSCQSPTSLPCPSQFAAAAQPAAASVLPAACRLSLPAAWVSQLAVAPPRELRAPDHKNPSCKREAARWDNRGQQQETPDERSPVTCPGCRDRDDTSPRWARQSAAKKGNGRDNHARTLNTRLPRQPLKTRKRRAETSKTNRAGGGGSGENGEPTQGRTRRGRTRTRPRRDKQTQKRKEA